MAPKVIVSYDGTDNDDDALALGRVLALAGASLVLAYVRHTRERESAREGQAQREAEQMLERGAAWLGTPTIPRYVIFSPSTPEGLAELAAKEQADLVVFGSEYRTAPDHVQPQASAERLLEGGTFGVAIAPAKLHERDFKVETVAAVSENGDTSAQETALGLATQLGAKVVASASDGADLLVIGSKPGTSSGRVDTSATALYLIATIRCPVLVVPRGKPIRFGGAADVAAEPSPPAVLE
jgi:nucleotide-binding universal stress UspA family protein